MKTLAFVMVWPGPAGAPILLATRDLWGTALSSPKQGIPRPAYGFRMLHTVNLDRQIVHQGECARIPPQGRIQAERLE